MTDTKLLYYDFINEFKRQYYKDLLTTEHLVGGQIKIDKLHYEDGSIEDSANFWGWVFEKAGEKYLLPARSKSGVEFKLAEQLPILARNVLKVANKGIVYNLIITPVSAKIKPEQCFTFRDTMDILSSLSHSNKRHQKLLWFIGIACMFERLNFRLCTPAGFGKDSTVDILGNLIGGTGTIENPTLAKLEYMTANKWLCVNEIVHIKGEEWAKVEQFLLATGAFKPEVNKHSRAFGGTKEVLQVANLSLSLLYNDIDHYPDYEKYFDFISSKQLKDRFPGFRLYGVISEDFNAAKYVNVQQYVRENYDCYKQLVYNFAYWKANYSKFLHNYNTDLLMQDLPERWKINIGRVLKIIDCYCTSQDEFNSWIVTLNESVQDYKDMVHYAKPYNELRKSIKEIEKIEPMLRTPKQVEELQLLNEWKSTIDKEVTYTNKLKLLYNKPQSINTSTSTYIKDNKFW